MDLVLRTSALLLVASLITRVLIKAAPATRHLIWHAGLLSLVAVAASYFPARLGARVDPVVTLKAE